MSAPTEVVLSKPKRIRRWAKRPSNPNDEFPNVSLSVRDVNLIVTVLKDHGKKIEQFKDRDSKSEQRLVQKLIEKLGQVKWTP